ncbi:MAG TPA: type II secretion system F family protein [Gaiellaceae bacterium]|nr:type II secretion system F family protein [Gaiellaceae bacterium]
MLFLIVAVGLLALSGFLVSEVVSEPERQRRTLVRRAAHYGAVRAQPTDRDRASLRDRMLVPATGRIARLMLRLNPRESLDTVQQRLLAAGMHDVSPSGFLAAKAILAGGGLAFGLLLMMVSSAQTGLLLTFAFVACGWIAPGFIVGKRATSRREQIGRELPDALDLLAVSVEAGLGFDGAIAKLTEHMEGSLVDELSLALGEMRVGESRTEALKKFAGRVDTPEVSSFVRAIIQADQLGISLGKILRVQATDSRLKRQAAAEEKAMKAPIKMLFPTVIFVFPAMFIVILGPAFMSLKQMFGF